jgi:predicted NAD-dependent protein-ADP-ribosyltransferase YbiA (DUF1768 family)
MASPLNIGIQKYTDKSIVVRGDFGVYNELLHQLGGKRYLYGGQDGWMFAAIHEDKVRNALQLYTPYVDGPKPSPKTEEVKQPLGPFTGDYDPSQASNDKLYFYSKSKDVKAGKGVNEVVSNPNDYTTLNSVKGWRQILSNFYVCPFRHNGATWNTMEHFYQSKKFVGYDFEWQFCLESGSVFSKDPAMAKGAGGKTGKSSGKLLRPRNVQTNFLAFKPENNDRIYKVGMICKFVQCPQLGQVLLATGNAQLWHIVSRSKPIRFTYLEHVRHCIRTLGLDNIDAEATSTLELIFTV